MYVTFFLHSSIYLLSYSYISNCLFDQINETLSDDALHGNDTNVFLNETVFTTLDDDDPNESNRTDFGSPAAGFFFVI